MIKIFRQDNMSIYIEFDEDGNKNFLDMFNEILKEKILFWIHNLIWEL